MTPTLRLGLSGLLVLIGVMVCVGGGGLVGFALSDMNGPWTIAGLVLIYAGCAVIGAGHLIYQRKDRRVRSTPGNRSRHRG